MTIAPTAEFELDVATALNQGARARQEDALASSFSLGSESGFAVLADGMGGHAAGDIASRIVVTEVFAELTLQLADPEFVVDDIPFVLEEVVEIANGCLQSYAEDNPESRDMGATVVVAVVFADQLYWISIGDSPLFLFRDGQLRRLNDDHSMAPQIDLMARKGLIDAEAAMTHPQRSCLTSALTGEAIPQMDCTETPFRLEPGDLIVLASDGLQYLSDDGIVDVLNRSKGSASARIAGDLMSGVMSVDDPEQDNVSMVVIKADAQMVPAGVLKSTRKWSFSDTWASMFQPVRQLVFRNG